MLFSTYDPNCTASCPHCKKATKCYNEGGWIIGFSYKLKMICQECKKKFKFISQPPDIGNTL